MILTVVLIVHRYQKFKQLWHRMLELVQVVGHQRLRHPNIDGRRPKPVDPLGMYEQRTLDGMKGIRRVIWIRKNCLLARKGKALAGARRGRRGLLRSTLASARALLARRTAA